MLGSDAGVRMLGSGCWGQDAGVRMLGSDAVVRCCGQMLGSDAENNSWDSEFSQGLSWGEYVKEIHLRSL